MTLNFDFLHVKMVIVIEADSQMEQSQSTEENGMHSHQMMRAY